MSEHEELYASSSGVWTSLHRLWEPTRIRRTFSRAVLAVMRPQGLEWEVPAILFVVLGRAFKVCLPGSFMPGVMEAPAQKTKSNFSTLFWSACLLWPDQTRKSEVNTEQPSRITAEWQTKHSSHFLSWRGYEEFEDLSFLLRTLGHLIALCEHPQLMCSSCLLVLYWGKAGSVWWTDPHHRM